MTTTTTILIWTLVFLALGFAGLFCWAMIKLSANKKQEDKKEDEPTTTASEEDGNPDETDTDENGEGTSEENPGEAKPCACTEPGALKTANEALDVAKVANKKADKNAYALAEIANPDVVAEIKANEAEVDVLTDKLSEAEKKLKNRDKKCKKLLEAETKAKTAMSEARTEYLEAEADLSVAADELEAADTKVSELNGKATEEVIKEAAKELESAKGAYDNVKAVRDAKRQVYKETYEQDGKKIFCKVDLYNNAVQERKEMENKTVSAEKEVAAIKAEIDKLEKRNIELRNSLKANG